MSIRSCHPFTGSLPTALVSNTRSRTFGNASVKSTESTLCYPRALVCSSSLTVTIHQLSISAKEYFLSKRLAEAKDAIFKLFPRVYDTGPGYHHASLSRDPKTSSMISSKSGRGGLFIVFVGRLHRTIRSVVFHRYPAVAPREISHLKFLLPSFIAS